MLVGRWRLIWTKIKWKHYFSLKISYFHFFKLFSDGALFSMQFHISWLLLHRNKSKVSVLVSGTRVCRCRQGCRSPNRSPLTRLQVSCAKHQASLQSHKKPIKCFHILSKKFLDQVLIDIPISPTNIISCKTHALHLFATKNCTNLRRVKSLWDSQFNCRPPSA